MKKLLKEVNIHEAHISEKRTSCSKVSENVVNKFEDLKAKHPLPDYLEDIYPMSDIEIGMSYGYLLHKGEGMYHNQFVYPLFFKDFDLSTFQKALNLLIQKHDILRTSYDIQSYGIPMRLIHNKIELEIGWNNLTETPKEKQQDHIEAFMKEQRSKVFFDIAEPGIWKMDIFKTDDNVHYLVFQFLHAILDDKSRASLITELSDIYVRLHQDVSYQPEIITTTYKDYVLEQETLKQQESVQEYWQQSLIDYKRLECFAEETTREITTYDLNEKLYNELEKFSTEQDISIKNICFAIYGYTLQKLSYHSDFLVGLITSTRPSMSGSDEILGCFLNSVPVRLHNENVSLLDFIKLTDQMLESMKSYEKLSLGELSRQYAEEDEGNPFFDTMFKYVDYREENMSQLINVESQPEVIKVDRFEQYNTYLNLIVSPKDQGLSLEWSRSRKLKSGLTNSNLVKIFNQALQHLVNPETQHLPKSYHFYDEQIKHKILHEFNATENVYPVSETLISLFEKQVAKTPNKTVLVHRENELSYEEVNAKANQFANFLQLEGVRQNDLVAVLLGRDHWTMIVLLGIYKAGASYVPLDINYPEERIDFLVKDCNCSLVVNDLLLQKFFEGNYSSDPIKINTSPQDLAYIIYTSGSTGTPKGVMIKHENVVATITDIDKQLGYEHLDKLALIGNISFDISITEIWGTLCCGKEAVIFDHEQLSSPEKFIEALQKHQVEILQITPSRLSLIEENLRNNEVSSLKLLIVGGEAFPRPLFENRASMGIPIVNVYGPTETTVWSSGCNLDASEVLTIGKPLQTDEIYILNDHQSLQPIGVVGEICISGACMAKGYLNLPDLTAERFLSNPFDDSKRLYRTGDLGRWLPDGNIEFIGRIDNQVKIRGYRIELGEIEQVLLTHSSINEAAVTVKDIQGELKMIAYVAGKKNVEISELRNYISQKLPEYMIPAHFIILPALPLNTRGKLDRKRLPEIAHKNIQSDTYQEPKTENEKAIANIWEEILGIEKVGVEDNFFKLGGSSLSMIRVISKIREKTQMNVGVQAFNAKPTIKDILSSINNGNALSSFSLIQAPKQKYYPVLDQQIDDWIYFKIKDKSTFQQNLHTTKTIKGCDKLIFEKAFADLLKRHELLRTIFIVDGGKIKQKVCEFEEVNYTIGYHTLSSKNLIDGFLKEDKKHSFDLERGPLFRMNVIDLPNDENFIILTIPHILTDSRVNPIPDLLEIYSSYLNNRDSNLKPLTYQFKDFTYSVHKMNDQEKVRSRNFWKLKSGSGMSNITLALKEDFDNYQIIRDKAKNEVVSKVEGLGVEMDTTLLYVINRYAEFEGRSFNKVLSEDITQQLSNIARQTETSLFSVITSIFKLWVSYIVNQDEIFIAYPDTLRKSKELNELYGWLSGGVLVKTKIDKEQSLFEYIKDVNQAIIKAAEHSKYSIQRMHHDCNHSLSFHVPLHINYFTVNDSITNAKTDLENNDNVVYELAVDIHKYSDGIFLHARYLKTLLPRERMEHVYMIFEQIIDRIISLSDGNIKEIFELRIEKK